MRGCCAKREEPTVKPHDGNRLSNNETRRRQQPLDVVNPAIEGFEDSSRIAKRPLQSKLRTEAAFKLHEEMPVGTKYSAELRDGSSGIAVFDNAPDAHDNVN